MNNKNIVKVSHELNHFRGGYTRLELDFIFAFISTIRDEDEDFKPYSLTLSQLEKKLNKRLNLKDIEYIFKTLINKTFEIDNARKYAVYSFFTALSFDKENKILEVKFNPDLKPHLIDLYNKVTNKDGRLFAQGDLKYILALRSEYSKRLYMLMCQWKKGVKVVHSVDSLRSMLAVPKSYRYNDFKRHVLLKAEAELIEKADICFEFEEIKEGKKVTDILFRVRYKGDLEPYKPRKLPKALESFINKDVYFSGRDWKIVHLSMNEDKSIHTILAGEYGQMAESFSRDQLKKMVEYVQNKPALF